VRSRRAKTFVFLQSDIMALLPRVKKAFFANLAAGMQCLKEAKQVSAAAAGADVSDPIARQTVLRQLSHAKKVLFEAQTTVPSCPVVNLHCGLVMAEIARLKAGPRCDSLFDSAYERFQASLDIKPLEAAYDAYVAALRSHAGLKRRLLGARAEAEAARELDDRADRLEAARLADERLALPGKSCISG
jgi:hypothetical protein